MQLHEHLFLPADVELKLTSAEMEFMLSTLTRIHTSLVDTVRDVKVAKDIRQEAYDFARNTELMYASLMNQLKLYGPKREDLH